MPIIAYKEKLKHGIGEEKISIAFNCEYNETGNLKLKDCNNLDHFDCGDFRIKIEKAIKKFNPSLLKKYEEKNKGVYCLAVLNYFVDEIPSIYSIKFEAEKDESIYYKDEIIEK